jgi:hypothetical protein
MRLTSANDGSAALVCGHGEIDRAVVEGVAVVEEVAALVRGARLDEGDVHRQARIIEHLLALEACDAADVFARGIVHAPAALAGIDERADSDRRRKTLSPGRRRPEQLHQRSHRQVVCDQDIQLMCRCAAETRRDHPSHQAFAGQTVQAGIRAALAAAAPLDHGDRENGQAARGAFGGEPLGERLDQRLGRDPVAAARNGKRRAVRNKPRRLSSIYDAHTIPPP